MVKKRHSKADRFRRKIRPQTQRQSKRPSLQTEMLEERRLLVTGPQLIAVIPNSGDVLQDGNVLNVAPQQLTLVFNEGQEINGDTLDAIRITRSGGDNLFIPAEATSDLGTDAEVVLKFTAQAGGVSGNGIVIQFTQRDFGGVGGPLVTVEGETISVELNSNLANPTTAAELVTALNGNLASNALIEVTLDSGSAAAVLGTQTVIPTIQLEGSNTARSATDFNTDGVLVEFIARASGADGNGITVNFDHQDLGNGASPFVETVGTDITITLNTRAGSESTAEQVVLAVNNAPAASQLVTAKQSVGNLNTDVSTNSVGIPGLVLAGANDVEIIPGYIGVDPDRPNQVIIRFAEPLPDDSYGLDILGIGDNVLTNSLLEPFNCDQDARIEFQIDRGANVLGVVPQPIVRDVNGDLTQTGNVIDVYFNDDDLDPVDATNPAFYQLIKTQDTVTNTDDELFMPTEVVYDADADSVRLTFGADPAALPGGVGTYRLRIGTDEAMPLPPMQFEAVIEATSDFGTSGLVNLRFSTPVDSGNTIRLNVTAADLGAGAGPGIAANLETHVIDVVLNSNPGSETTAQELVDAFNADPYASFIAISEVADGDANANVATSIAANPESFVLAGVGATYDTASDLGVLTTQSQIISASIDPQEFVLDLPGDNDDPGHRDIIFDPHNGPADAIDGISTLTYNFRTNYGFDQTGQPLFNVITETQKQRVREVFDVMNDQLGIQFIEVSESELANTLMDGFETVTVAVGDLRAVGGNSALGGTVWQWDLVADPDLGQVPTIVLDNAELWNDEFGALSEDGRSSFYRETNEAILSVLGVGQALDLPEGTLRSDDLEVQEAIFPGDHDLVHAQHRFRPEGKDIDLYRFELDEPGRVTVETIAERQLNSSLLDSVITLFRQNPDGSREKIAQNDDYFSEDSFLDLNLEAGTYFVGVSASGNNTYDPHVQDSGFGGTTQGDYDLRINFRPATNRSIQDTTGVDLDGDNDGNPGGVHNFWFRSGNTIVVDKSASDGGDGSLAAPYNTISTAFAATTPGDIVRIVGNGGDDDDVATLEDNLAYEIGFGSLNQSLADGTTMEVPQGVSVMVDAGAIFKLRSARIGVGSSAPTIDRSGGTLQVLGTPASSVIFTSYGDESIGVDTDPLPSMPRPGDWGGISFRNELDKAEGRFDYESVGVFLNYVNFADMRYGGGDVVVNSIEQIVTPIQFLTSRPTISNNTITNSADAAISGDPDSFEETNFHAVDSRGIDYQATPFTSDYDRVGPDIQGNRLSDNSINGLFFRIATPAGGRVREMTVSGRWDDTDIVHVLAENLVVRGRPGGPLVLPGSTPPVEPVARTDASLFIDPSTIVKLDSSRIEATFGATFMAEGDPGQQIIFTSLRDVRFGAGGTFDTSPLLADASPRPGDWGGIYVSNTASAFIDHAQVNFGGGVTKIEGSFSGFNAVEIHQGFARIANTRFERNADGVGGQQPSDTNAREGRGNNDESVIFVRGAQPIIVHNTFVENVVRTDDNGGLQNPAISIDVNSLNHHYVIDEGRASGFSDALNDVQDNQGPLIHENQMTDRSIHTGRILGMVVRGGILNVESVWDDTDMTHVLFDEVIVPDFHTFGGLHLESAVDESLVVKLQGATAGFTALGEPHEIVDRIGGRIQLIGQPGFPVVLTSLADDSVGAGTTPDGQPLNDTNSDSNENEVGAAPAPGDWRSVQLQQYSHDRNVETINEAERVDAPAPGPNGTTQTAQVLGQLAPSVYDGDDNRRLGFEIHGFLTGSSDADVYSFEGSAGTEVRFDIDKTSQWLDTVVELVDANGQVIAASDNSLEDENPDTGLIGTARRLAQSDLRSTDYWSTNPRDAGFRAVLPGAQDSINTYHVRVRMSQQNLSAGNANARLGGNYELGLRLTDIDEVAGSVIRFSNIRYASTGIEVQGLVAHSPLIGEAHEVADLPNDTFDTAQSLGNLLATDRGTISLSGNLATGADIDWYSFEVEHQEAPADQPTTVVFDLDYADQLGRANTAIYLFDSTGQLVYYNEDGNASDDLPAPQEGTDLDDLSRGSVGSDDPFLGPVSLDNGTYFVAIASRNRIPTVLADSGHNSSNGAALDGAVGIRLEPAISVARIAEDHIGGGVTSNANPGQILIEGLNEVPYHLGDVPLIVSSGGTTTNLDLVDAMTGTIEGRIGTNGELVEDLLMRWDGRLFGLTSDYGGASGIVSDDWGELVEFSILDGSVVERFESSGIETFEEDGMNPGMSIESDQTTGGNGVGIHFQAFVQTIGIGNQNRYYAVGHRPAAFNMPPSVLATENVLFRLAEDGEVIAENGVRPGTPDPAAFDGAGTNFVETGFLDTANAGSSNNQISVRGGNAITDGDLIVANGATFEMVTGPMISYVHEPGNGTTVRDGLSFTLENPTTTFAFETGPVLVLDNAVTGVSFSDGQILTITSDAGTATTFEFDRLVNGMSDGVQLGRTAILYSDDLNAVQLADVIATTVEAAGGLGVGTVVTQGSRISLVDDSMTFAPTTDAPAINIEGDHDVAMGVTPIRVEEFWDTSGPVDIDGDPGTTNDIVQPAEFGNAIVNAVASAPGTNFQPSIDPAGMLINFPGAVTGDFTAVENRGVFTDTGNDGNAAPGRTPIPFGIGWPASGAAPNIADTIAGVMASHPSTLGTTSMGLLVVLGSGQFDVGATSDPPFTVGGSSAGGLITGLAEIETGPGVREVFAVSDTGGVFSVDVQAGSITQISDLGVSFQGLTAGPVNVEEGRFANVMFGIDDQGDIHAFDNLGVLQPVFADGTGTLSTGIQGADGIEFGKVDYNLWHQTTLRGGDGGHIQAQPFNRTRNAEAGANSSFYFGFENFNVQGLPNEPLKNPGLGNTYNVPGGASGAIETAAFDLTGYEAADQPVFYFNYFMETEADIWSQGDEMRDSFRVFVSDDTGVWQLIGTNNDYEGTAGPGSAGDWEDLMNGAGTGLIQTGNEFAYNDAALIDAIGNDHPTDSAETRSGVERLVDDGQWRQARIDLADYAGKENIRFRFEFTTAGTRDIGGIGGSVLTTVDGEKLVDGDTFIIDGNPFEFDLGFVLAFLPGQDIPDGETFDITDSMGATVTFEFDKGDGVSGGNTAILVGDDNSPTFVADAAEEAIANAGLAGMVIHQRGRRLQIEPATMDITPSAAFDIEGTPGTAGTAIEVHWDLPSWDADPMVDTITSRVRDVLASVLSNGVSEAIRVHRNSLNVFGAIEDPGPLGRTQVFDPNMGVFVDGLQGDAFGEAVGSNTYRLTSANNDFEGVYIDNLVVGFASRGELVTEAPADTTFVDRFIRGNNTTGAYQLEIRQGETFTTQFGALHPAFRAFDIQDRLSAGHSFEAPAGADIADGQSFVVGAGTTVTLEFDSDGMVESGHFAVPYEIDSTANEVAQSIVSVLNSFEVRQLVAVSAAVTETGTRVDVFGDTSLLPSAAVERIDVQYNDEIPFAVHTGIGFGESGVFVGEGALIETDVDIDMVQVDMLTGQRLWADVDSDVVYGFTGLFPDMTLRIFDADGNELALNDSGQGNRERDDNSLDPYIEFTAPADGSYFIAVNSDMGTPGTYDLIVTVGGFGPIFETYDLTGDPNLLREQGQLIIGQNRISSSETYGIVVEPGTRDPLPHPGFPRTTREENTEALIEGISIVNNVIDGSLVGAIRFAGDDSDEFLMRSAVPFGRIVNNTLYGVGGDLETVAGTADTGILIEDNAGPTLLNNIIANFETPISLDASSFPTTVIGGTLYKDNTESPDLLLGDFNIDLDAAGVTNRALFVDPANGNYYLEADSLAIDSSISSLEERPSLTRVKNPLGIATSPILAPDIDLFGLIRVDDPNVETPQGLGENVFIDRGAIDRADTNGPTVELGEPVDNDQFDQDPTETSVQLLGADLTRFVIEFQDGGVGIDDQTVTPDGITVTRNGVDLVIDTDYRFDYDSTNNRLLLSPQAGIWLPGSYVVTLDNTVIADLASNPLQPNQVSGQTLFRISIGEGLDFGDAPDPAYPTLSVNDGARHGIQSDFFLGSGISSEADALHNPDANGDSFDDGVAFSSLLVPDTTGVVMVTSSADAKLDGWIDFNADGDWDDAGEQILTSTDLLEGTNELTFSIPVDALEGTTYARFRMSSAGGLGPTGLAGDGEVEDYQVLINDPGIDFGDAPNSYGTALADDGARHEIVAGFYLGAAADGEPDGLASPDAAGDGADDDGVIFDDFLVVNTTVNLTVTASQGGSLDGWIDFNADGDFDDAGEQVFSSRALVAGGNALTLDVPGTAIVGSTFARFRLSSAGGLSPIGFAADGEVEDYRVAIESEPPGPFDFGDAPASYGTLFVDDGARHIVDAGVFLGATLTDEVDGQPSPSAIGDDSDDGVAIGSVIRVESTTDLTVTASTTGLVSVWVDLNQDGDFTDSGEQVVTDESVVAGANTVPFDVPSDATLGSSFLRVRFSTQGGLGPIGEASDGEVEDYLISILEAASWHNADFPADVDNNGIVAPLDALTVINELNDRVYSDPLTGALPVADPPPFLDVNNDGFVSPLDANLVINQLGQTAPLSGSVTVPAAAAGASASSQAALVHDADVAREIALRSINSELLATDYAPVDEEPDEDDEGVLDSIFAEL